MSPKTLNIPFKHIYMYIKVYACILKNFRKIHKRTKCTNKEEIYIEHLPSFSREFIKGSGAGARRASTDLGYFLGRPGPLTFFLLVPVSISLSRASTSSISLPSSCLRFPVS